MARSAGISKIVDSTAFFLVFRASGGPPGAVLGALWCPLELLGRSWPLLGRCWAPLGPLLALLGPLWARLWAPPGSFWTALRASWASFGGPWSALGGLFGALGRKPENRRQYSVFLCFSGLRGPSWGLLGASGRLLERPSGPESGPVGPSGSESGPWSRPKWPLGGFCESKRPEKQHVSEGPLGRRQGGGARGRGFGGVYLR